MQDVWKVLQTKNITVSQSQSFPQSRMFVSNILHSPSRPTSRATRLFKLLLCPQCCTPYGRRPSSTITLHFVLLQPMQSQKRCWYIMYCSCRTIEIDRSYQKHYSSIQRRCRPLTVVSTLMRTGNADVNFNSILFPFQSAVFSKGLGRYSRSKANLNQWTTSNQFIKPILTCFTVTDPSHPGHFCYHSVPHTANPQRSAIDKPL